MDNKVYIYVMDFSVSEIFEYQTTQDSIDEYNNVEEFLMSRNININTCSFMVCDKRIEEITVCDEL